MIMSSYLSTSIHPDILILMMFPPKAQGDRSTNFSSFLTTMVHWLESVEPGDRPFTRRWKKRRCLFDVPTWHPEKWWADLSSVGFDVKTIYVGQSVSHEILTLSLSLISVCVYIYHIYIYSLKYFMKKILFFTQRSNDTLPVEKRSPHPSHRTNQQIISSVPRESRLNLSQWTTWNQPIRFAAKKDREGLW